jgi:hypothetical protein
VLGSRIYKDGALVKANTVQIAQLVVAIIALFTGWVLAGVAYQTFGRGPIPAKHLLSSNTGAVDILDDLRNAGDAISTSVIDAKGNKIDNIYSSTIYLVNSGSAPILASDFDGKVKLTTKEPWSIITVRNNTESGLPQFNWRKVNNTELEADPILINPGDLIDSTVYLTSGDPKPDVTSGPLIWDVRIANLRQIDYTNSNPVAQPTFPELLNVRVDYVGNNLLIFLLVFVAYFSAYVYFLSEQGYLSSRLTLVVYVVAAALFGLFAADVTVTYLTGPFDKINHALNAPILICNFLLLCWIVFWVRPKVSSTSDPAPGV